MKKSLPFVLAAMAILLSASCEKSKQTYTCTCNWTNILGENKSKVYQLDEYSRNNAENKCNMSHVNTIWPGDCYIQ